MLTPASTIAIVGFGGGCHRIAAALAPRGCTLRVFDPGIAGPADGGERALQLEALGVDVATSLVEALRGARLVVLDDSSAREQLIPALLSGQTLLDLHPVSDSAASSPERYLCGRFQPDGGTAGSAPLWINGAGADQLANALTAMGLATRAVESLPAVSAAEPGDWAMRPAARTSPATVLRGELP